jgi:hypothetical protein
MKATRKDFEAIASVVNDVFRRAQTQKLASKNKLILMRLDMAEELARVMSGTNPAFDRSRFITACTKPMEGKL